MLRLCRSNLVPVILGERIACSDIGDREKQIWACTMLVLFKPWRHPLDLKVAGQKWSNALENYEPYLSERHKQIIHNMGVLSECKDACDQNIIQCHHQQEPIRTVHSAMDDVMDETAYLMEEEDDAFGLFEGRDNDTTHQVPTSGTSNPLDSAVGVDCQKVLHSCLKTVRQTSTAHLTDGVGSEIDITAKKSRRTQRAYKGDEHFKVEKKA